MNADHQAACAAVLDRLRAGPATLTDLRQIAANAAWRVGSGPMLTEHGVNPLVLDRMLHRLRDKLCAAGRLETRRHNRHASTWRLV